MKGESGRLGNSEERKIEEIEIKLRNNRGRPREDSDVLISQWKAIEVFYAKNRMIVTIGSWRNNEESRGTDPRQYWARVIEINIDRLD